MSEVVLTKQKLRPGKTERLRVWAEEIREFEDERMHLEAAFVEHTDDGPFLVYFMKADDVDAVIEAFEDSDHEIDHEHAEVLDAVSESPERVGDYELLYWLDNPNRPQLTSNRFGR